MAQRLAVRRATWQKNYRDFILKTSSIIITKNAEPTIRRCIESLAWTDEVIVVDSGSTDRTEEICVELGVRFYRTPDFPGHGPQKNRALDKAQGEWIVSLDSDEWMLPELQAELEKTIARFRVAPVFADVR
jgi:glycosyltransferase involved in cell wall biosynthesis